MPEPVVLEPVEPAFVDDVVLDDVVREDAVADGCRVVDDVAVDRCGDDAADELLCDPPAEVDDEWWLDPDDREVLEDGLGLGDDGLGVGFGLGFGVLSLGGGATPGAPPAPKANPMTDPAGG